MTAGRGQPGGHLRLIGLAACLQGEVNVHLQERHLDEAEKAAREYMEIFGPDNSVNDMAEQAGTIPYELTCAVSKRVPRIYLRQGQEIARELLLRF